MGITNEVGVIPSLVILKSNVKELSRTVSSNVNARVPMFRSSVKDLRLGTVPSGVKATAD